MRRGSRRRQPDARCRRARCRTTGSAVSFAYIRSQPIARRPEPSRCKKKKKKKKRIARRPPEAGLLLVTALIVAAVLLRPALTGLLAHPAAANWATIFVAITIQATPFLVLGVAVSATIAAFVPPGAIARLLPNRPVLAVPAAAVAGAALPGCECGSVPVAARLVSIGVTPAAAFAFLLSAPAINPVVLVSTAVAFPGDRGWARPALSRA